MSLAPGLEPEPNLLLPVKFAETPSMKLNPLNEKILPPKAMSLATWIFEAVMFLASRSPLALILPEAVMCPLPDNSNEPVIPESPFLCPVDRKVCDADTKFWPCQEPEIFAAIWAEELRKV